MEKINAPKTTKQQNSGKQNSGPQRKNDQTENFGSGNRKEYRDLESEGFGPGKGEYRDLQSEGFGPGNGGNHDLQHVSYGAENRLQIQDLCYRGNPDNVKMDDLVYRGTDPEITFVNHSNTGKNSIIKDKVMELENGNRAGYNAKEGKFYPHKSPEGGLDTIGYGIKCQSQKEQDHYRKHGLTDTEARALYDKKWDEARSKAEQNLGRENFAKATRTQQDLATELAYNKGNLKGYNNFQKEFKQGNTQGLMEQNNRGFFKDGEYKKLITRQKEVNEAAKKQIAEDNQNAKKFV